MGYHAQSVTRARIWLTKVPAITATFWVINVLSTTIGLGPLITDALMIAVLAGALVVQLRTRGSTGCAWCWSASSAPRSRTSSPTPWGVSLSLSTGVFAVVLAAVFAVWCRQEGTLAIASVDTARREGFYRGAILTTFALGAAAGDLATKPWASVSATAH